MKINGFTLVEILITIAILCLLAGIAFPGLRSMLIANYLNTSGSEIVQSLRQAQANAMSGAEDSKWGVFFDVDNNKFIFFKGATFPGPGHAYNLTTELPASIKIKDINFNGGGAEIIFEKTSGKTNQYGSLTLSSLNNQQTKDIIINEHGMVKAE